MAEDTVLPIPFLVADTTDGINTSATSSNLVILAAAGLPTSPASGTVASRTLNVQPAANRFGTVTVTITAISAAGPAGIGFSEPFVLTITPVADTPCVTNATTEVTRRRPPAWSSRATRPTARK